MHTFQDLDGKINNVATKVLHLGDQLDNVNGPRARVVEAQRLMTHLNEFLTPGHLQSVLFNDPFRVNLNCHSIIGNNFEHFRLTKRQM